MKIIFITDVEGRDFLAYLRNTLKMEQNTSLEEMIDKIKKESINIVFGGDAFDKGSYNFSSIRNILRLKQELKDNVDIILGNRDINKLRIDLELDTLYIDLLLKEKAQSKFKDPRKKGFKEYANEIGVNDKSADDQKKITYFKWMLECTMAAPKAWLFYQIEVLIERIQESELKPEIKEELTQKLRQVKSNEKLKEVSIPPTIDLPTDGEVLDKVVDFYEIDFKKYIEQAKFMSIKQDIAAVHGGPLKPFTVKTFEGRTIRSLDEAKEYLQDNPLNDKDKQDLRRDQVKDISPQAWCYLVIQQAGFPDNKGLGLPLEASGEVQNSYMRQFPQDQGLPEQVNDQHEQRGSVHAAAIWDMPDKELEERMTNSALRLYLSGHKPFGRRKAGSKEGGGRSLCLHHGTLFIFGDNSFNESEDKALYGGVIIEHQDIEHQTIIKITVQTGLSDPAGSAPAEEIYYFNNDYQPCLSDGRLRQPELFQLVELDRLKYIIMEIEESNGANVYTLSRQGGAQEQYKAISLECRGHLKGNELIPTITEKEPWYSLFCGCLLPPENHELPHYRH